MDKSREDYIGYKYMGKSIILADKYVAVEILSYLERLGFPMERKGTYAYKDLVVMVCNELQMVEQYGDETCLKLISCLKDSESDIYRRLALKLEISLDTLHVLFNDVVSMINYDVMDESFLKEVYEEYSSEINYGELAFVLASMVLGYKRKRDKKNIKIRSL